MVLFLAFGNLRIRKFPIISRPNDEFKLLLIIIIITTKKKALNSERLAANGLSLT